VTGRVTVAELLELLKSHVGRERGISQAELAAHLGCSTRHARKLVQAARMDSIAVCGHPDTGHFIARTREELEETCEFLRSRALSSLVQESKLRGMPLADLVGQLKVPT